MKTPVLFAALALAAVVPTHAQNNKGGGSASGTTTVGVITIDQAKAEAGGVTPGDAPGFPVTISQPGTYRLMSNLTVASSTTHAIQITGNNVTLDLNGFSIIGPGACSETGGTGGITCTPADSANYGVDASNRSFTSVRGGSVRGFAEGVAAGFFADVSGLRISDMRYGGISAGVNSSVTDNVIARVRTAGIYNNGLTRNNLIYFAQTGVSASGGLIEGNRILYTTNGISGGSISQGSAVVGNVMSTVTTPLYQVIQIGQNLCNSSVCP